MSEFEADASGRELTAERFVAPGGAVNWYELELASFSEHPEVQAEFRHSGRVKAWEIALAIPTVLLVALVWLSPILGVAAIAQNRFQNYTAPAEEMIPLAGGFYAVSLATLLVMIIRWLLRGRRRSWGSMVFAVMVTVLGSLTGVAIAVRAEEESVDSWQGWAAIVWVAVVVSAVFWLMLLLTQFAGRRASADSDYLDRPPKKKLELLAHRRAIVAELSSGEQADVKRARDESIQQILDRGSISRDVAARASAAEVGALQLTMIVRL